VIRTALTLLADLLRLLRLIFQSRAQLAAENLFLRKQLACYIERKVRPRRADNPTRVALVLLSRCVAWRELLTVVRPDTLVRWHRLKLGLTVSPRTVRRYMPPAPRPWGGQSTQSWATFLHNHAGAVLACDFFVVVTATFQRLYVFALFDMATRRVVHWNVTAHPTAGCQQLRNGVPLDSAYRFVVHDRDAIFAPAVDDALRSMSLEVLKTPVRPASEPVL
jgi:putative transposase